NVKQKIEEISPGLPAKVVIDRNSVTAAELSDYALRHGLPDFGWSDDVQAQWRRHLAETSGQNRPDWLRLSQVTIVPFYDRTGLIYETLGTLNDAVVEQILITLIVVVAMAMHLRSSVLIGSMLPLTVLGCFVAMKLFNVDANIVALSGIAIAIGTIVDMGIVICENIIRHFEEAPPHVPRIRIVHRAASEVGGAVITAVATTVVGFLPVFVMTGAEGKLFTPLAFTKTFALMASIVIALTILPAGSLFMLAPRVDRKSLRKTLRWFLVAVSACLAGYGLWHGWMLLVLAACIAVIFSLYGVFESRLPPAVQARAGAAANILIVLLVGVVLSVSWEPLGSAKGAVRNFLFVAMLVVGWLGAFWVVRHFYERLLTWALEHKVAVLSAAGLVTLFGFVAWLGFARVFAWAPAIADRTGIGGQRVRSAAFWVVADELMPGFGREFMPPLDEGSFLYMPTTMTHASIGEALDILAKQGAAFAAIPEIEQAVGKIGRADSALDPAPVSMIETLITYKPEYITDRHGRRVNFRYDSAKGEFVRDENGELVPDSRGRPFRQWRDEIRNPDDIWEQIVKAGQIPGTTSAPRLQPIAARIVMLQSGMRAPMGIKVRGPDLATIESFSLQLERLLKQVPQVEPAAVIADRVIGKPYLEIVPDRDKLARYGISMSDFQDVVEMAIGGRKATTVVAG
ncbi:MAG TPA: efflux RND transporter permease subunit, partial [Sedimentisphaerales bacterium]|nr:efflux RND transporter permease subunit [Sedimentisphaerales bacterium]